MLDFISIPMGWILSQLSGLFNHNFAVSVLVFTILVNIVMLPLTIKSLKSTAKQAKIKHKLDALKKKYGDDRQKYSMAMQELYNKEGISMGGGCMPMIIRLVIMMGVYYAISSPFTYVVNVDKVALNSAKEWTAYVQVAESDADWEALGLEAKADSAEIKALAEKYGSEDYEHYAKIAIVRDIKNSKESFSKNSPEKAVKDKCEKIRSQMREVVIANYLNDKHDDYEPLIADVFTQNNGDVKKINGTKEDNAIDFMLFKKIDLRDTPKFSMDIFNKFEPNWLIPLASFVSAVLTGVLSSIMQKKNNPEAPSMMGMMLIMPLFSLYIAFGFPCAVGFYWACSSLVAGGIQLITQTVYGPQAVNAREQAKSVVARAKVEKAKMSRLDTIEE